MAKDLSDDQLMGGIERSLKDPTGRKTVRVRQRKDLGPLSAENVVRLYLEGESALSIAAMLGNVVEQTTIRNRLKEAGIDMRIGRPRLPPLFDDPERLANHRARNRAARCRQYDKQREDTSIYPDPEPIDRRIRRKARCEAGYCRWLHPQCLLSEYAQRTHPCPIAGNPEPGYCTGLSGERDGRCKYYRAACSRRYHDCPYFERVDWICDNCQEKVPIGDIHFVYETPTSGLVERKFIGDMRNPERIATALCSTCLAAFRDARSERQRSGTAHQPFLRLW